MFTNVGVLDAGFRFAFGALLLALSYGRLGPTLSDPLVWPVWLFGLAFFLTGIFRFCPIYAFANTHSCARDFDENER